jgi:hypothetical protein
MDQVAIKYTNIFQCKTLQNLPKFGFLVWKQTIWQPCLFLEKQGCQIFLGTTSKNGENIYQMTIKYTRCPQKRPNGRKIDQIAIKCTNNIFHCKLKLLKLRRQRRLHPIYTQVSWYIERMVRGLSQRPDHSCVLDPRRSLKEEEGTFSIYFRGNKVIALLPESTMSKQTRQGQ